MLFKSPLPNLLNQSAANKNIINKFMYITTLFTLLVLTAALNCPLQQKLRSTILSGSLSAQPDANKNQQDMYYTRSFSTSLARTPQVCLSISGYEDANEGFMKINVDTESISQQSFVVRVKSPEVSKWTKLDVHYLVSTKPQIEIGTTSALKPIYDNNGFITLKYSPSISLDTEIKVRQFIVGIDIQSSSVRTSLAINFQKYEIKKSFINFYFSSSNCNIYSLAISVVIFDPTTPGLLFVDGSLQQNSLSTTTQVKIEKIYMEELRIYFVGFNSINAKDRSGLKLSVSFSKTFSLMIDSTSIKSIKVNYLVVSFIDCGSCSGYPYHYSGSCYDKCPFATVYKTGQCVPIDCKNGYQLNDDAECVPICGQNRYYSGKHCTCKDGYNLVKGECVKCPSGTVFNYMTLDCQDLCGDNSQFNKTDNRCYCYKGYVVINGKCSKCPSGTKYDSINQRCLDEPIDCNQNEVIAYGKCICSRNYYKINGKCQKCPTYSSYSNGFCECDDGYQMSGNSCVSTCKDNQVFISGSCQCSTGYKRNIFGRCVADVTCKANQRLSGGKCICADGYERNVFGVCVAATVTCPSLQILVNDVCKCIKGYKRGSDGRCYAIQCQPNFYLDDSDTCVRRCPKSQRWDTSSQACIDPCSYDTSYDQNIQSCVPKCQQGYKWNGVTCYCVNGCEVVCPTGTYYNATTRRCEGYNCQQNQIWDGRKCVCPTGYDYYAGYCRIKCGNNYQFVHGLCQCKRGYYEANGACIDGCPPGQRWDQVFQRCVQACSGDKEWYEGVCRCPQGTWQNGIYCVTCPANQQFVNNRCQCLAGFYLSGGVCIKCPSGQYYNASTRRCESTSIVCSNGKIWNGSKCVCPNGSVETSFGTCRKQCTSDKIQLPSGQCVCRSGQKQNGYGVCVNICDPGFDYLNGECTHSCGKGQVWSGYNCVCQNGFERLAPNVCAPACGINQQRVKNICQCKPGYQKSGLTCVPFPNTCPFPHTWSSGVCICASGFEKDQSGGCVAICQPGYVRNNKGICVPGCSDDKIWADGKCVCRVGLFNVNGFCSKCPEYSYESYGRCYCSLNNYPVSGGSTCPVPSCTDPNTYWDNKISGCVCKAPFIWLYGICQAPRNCGQNQQWNGEECVCVRGYKKIGGVCQRVNQTPYCPANSIFNGVNCRCIDGYYPVNNQYCQRCPANNYWNGRQCGTSAGVCQSGFEWDARKYACVYKPRCSQNQEWDGAQCICSQGYFWIDRRCQECPPGTVFDGKKCNRGQSNACKGPYSYFNGYACVCVPGFWQLAEGCVTCPSSHEWSGMCCLPRGGLLRSVSSQEPQYGMSVPMVLK